LRVAREVGEQHVLLGDARRLYARHHLGHERAKISFAAHPRDHPVDDRRPALRVVHRRIRQVVALDAIAQGQLRAFRARLGELPAIESRRQDPLEHRAVRAFRPTPPGRIDFVGACGESSERDESD
jgi:hypothetical protein